MQLLTKAVSKRARYRLNCSTRFHITFRCLEIIPPGNYLGQISPAATRSSSGKMSSLVNRLGNKKVDRQKI
jgi:hypothetical protein